MAFQYSLIKQSHYQEAAETLGVSVPVIKAVASVEGGSSGFVTGTNLPKILFEGHYFHKFTGGIFDNKAPTISYPKWTKDYYSSGKGEYSRLKEAIELNGNNPEPALKSASWGRFQIMGANHEPAGYATVEDFVDWMSMGETYQLFAFVSFIMNTELADELQSGDWAKFARGYNGPAYKKNNYDTKIAEQFRQKSLEAQDAASGVEFSLERGDLVLLQTALNMAIGAGLVTDGWIGNKTTNAIKTFQSTNGMPISGKIDKALCDELDIDCSHYLATAEE